MSTTYVAGWNTPGYLPEMEPAEFDNTPDAFAYLITEVERMWDEDMSTPEGYEDMGDERWLPVHTALHNAPGIPFAATTVDGVVEVWIVEGERAE
jgi:hypothetical protein